MALNCYVNCSDVECMVASCCLVFDVDSESVFIFVRFFGIGFLCALTAHQKGKKAPRGIPTIQDFSGAHLLCFVVISAIFLFSVCLCLQKWKKLHRGMSPQLFFVRHVPMQYGCPLF